jgi:hypothetical protein
MAYSTDVLHVHTAISEKSIRDIGASWIRQNLDETMAKG